ncbi:response regulator receiver domain [Longirhabdus pacifica]|uniref:response regulator receiver domain n=1 Tax=Longirhabdus pacifica TaxID=2305227 RepID=UPI001008C0FF|nr:response regulator receiver domain [Longirhabdus pacifica]
MQSSIIESAKDIVKDYFNNAVIIDDEFGKNTLSEQQTPIVIGNDEIDFSVIDSNTIEFVDGMNDQVAVTKENEQRSDSYGSDDVFERFINDGIITYPYCYDKTIDIQQNLLKIQTVLSNAKILIIDWQMEENNGVHPVGTAAKNILKMFTDDKSGLKCVVIYTKENKEEVLKSISHEYNILDEKSFFFQNPKEDGTSSLFGFVMNKMVSPDNLMGNIASVLIKDKSTTLHFMECAQKINNNIHKTIQKFNVSFEKVLFSQILTSEIANNEIRPFINDTLLSSVLVDDNTKFFRNHFLFERKKERLIIALKDKGYIEKETTDYLFDMLSIKLNELKDLKKKLVDKEFVETLVEKIANSEINCLEKFQFSIREICKETFEWNGNKLNKYDKQIVLLLILWESYISESNGAEHSNKEDFKKSFLKETVYFTRMMKFNMMDENNNIETGTIIANKVKPPRIFFNKTSRTITWKTNHDKKEVRIKNISKNNIKCKQSKVSIMEKYMLCITPLCDIANNKVKGNLKFIIGYKQKEVVENDLKNNKENAHWSAIPEYEGNKLIFIKWDFFNVHTLNNNEIEHNLMDGKLRKVGTLKKEYSQKIINRYISYQSRAGVNEMFYKESNYIKNFLKFVK